ncbi:helix-turn-helix domain-containing protein [Herbiconiux sp. 11R-BC]|uniref:TetR/AcrR family transcriptional regulator n=1 Tax=Herbiconiux sp. 11R-BC TaxID=3111637 RepID=UPI003C122B4E
MSTIRGGGQMETLGRRERSKLDKEQRIFQAAAELFESQGFEAVTTQAVSDRADVGTGTLFRYAATKGELLLMVYNHRFADAIAAGRRDAARADGLASAVQAAVAPLLEAGRSFSHNAMVYQRELMFGDPTDRFRAEGLALVAELEGALTSLLLTAGASAESATHAPGDAVAARRAARSIFAVVHLALVQPAINAFPDTDPVAEARAQMAQIVRGYGPTP